MAGLGIVTSTAIGVTDEPGRGVAYTPATLAAGKLVHCHCTSDNVFLCAYSLIWNAATADPLIPGAFTAKTALARSIFWWVGTDSGKSVPAVDRAGTPGYLYSNASPALVDGTSNGGMVYYLVIINLVPALLSYSVDKGTVDFVASNWVVNSVPLDVNGTPLEQVIWNKGVHSYGAHLFVVGERPSDHALYMCKKNLLSGWTYYLGSKGWSSDPATLSPLLDNNGAVLTSLGPVSVSTFQDTWYLSATAKPAANTIASFYRARHPLLGWTKMTQTVDLGTVTAAASAGVFFQQAVAASAALVGLADLDTVVGIPYTYTIESATALRTYWNALPVPRIRV